MGSMNRRRETDVMKLCVFCGPYLRPTERQAIITALHPLQHDE